MRVIQIPEKTRRLTASSGTISTCENPVTRPGIEPDSPWWEASVLIAQQPWSLFNAIKLMTYLLKRNQILRRYQIIFKDDEEFTDAPTEVSEHDTVSEIEDDSKEEDTLNEYHKMTNQAQYFYGRNRFK
ncbi:hypothetical protein PR048_003799 [Dryococelus australis]|uniref:Uncharacterized protein n=1 Tax=Dryococelus australis TaxID=614101 RepID=A0ABQ9IP11_9NEOP|nr:hypothetical protein PR048_003799 [Dryococelus australis]